LHLLAKEISRFNEIEVYETSELYGRMGNYRLLRFSDEAIQGAIDLKDPDRVVLEYQRAIIHLMELNNPLFESVFVIGHGAGTIAGHYPDKQFTVAEVDEKVVELSRLFFGYRKDNIVIGDGREILKEQEPNRFDYIIMDAFTMKGTPFHLTTLEFFKMTIEKLHFQGAIIINLVGKIKNGRLIAAIHTTIRETYGYTKAFFLQESGRVDAGNVIIMGSNRSIAVPLRDMAGFKECEIRQGHIIMDSETRIP
jgi:spermidine synthase